MGAVSKAAIAKSLGLILQDIADALDRGVSLDEIAIAIVALEAKSSQTPRRG